MHGVILFPIPCSLVDDPDDQNMVKMQLPVNICFAVMINKSQGQTFDLIGIYLSAVCFDQGLLYVSLSRCRYKKEQNPVKKRHMAGR